MAPPLRVEWRECPAWSPTPVAAHRVPPVQRALDAVARRVERQAADAAARR
jgi:hypothetical protein